MKKYILKGLPLLAIAFLVTNCRKKAWDEKYDRPDSLEPPIYQVLDAKGNFKNLLALIDKAGYKETMTGAGYWTLFAPDDSAFSVYFKDKGISGVGAIDSGAARAMIQYWLVYNTYKKDRLDDYQATANNAGWTPSLAFRRRTAYYTGFYKDTASGNKPIVAVANNRNNTSSSLTGNYVSSDYNNKYITYFTDDYMSAAGLSASDYNYFYPKSQYTGFNVAEARVVNKDIIAENGVIHEIDKVITPLMNIDEYIRTRPEYSSFRAILNRLYTNNLVQFIYNADVTHRYQVLTGKGDSVFVKVYSSLLSFSPNNENFMKVEDNDGQKDCWTMFIPKNEAVDAFVKGTLCKYYPSLDEMPIEVIADFLNAHLFPTAVWPSRFATTRNKFSEPARFDPQTDIFDRQILSNGIVYGTNKVEVPDVFSTVYGYAYLHPGYSMMNRLLNVTGLKLIIAKSNVPVDLLLIPDQAFAAAGYSYNVSKDQFEYRSSPTASSTTNGVYDRLTRIANSCVFFDMYKARLENVSDSAVIKSGDVSMEGDYIKYKKGRFGKDTILTSGLQDAGKFVLVDSSKTASNGRVFYLSDMILHTDKPVGYHIRSLGLSTSSQYNYFWQLLSNSSFFNATTYDIAGLTGFNTVFVPTNAAIKQAVIDGILPGNVTTGAPTFAPSNETDKDRVRKFLLYHFISGHTFSTDGAVPLLSFYDTYLKNLKGDALRVSLFNSPGAMTIFDNYNRGVNVITGQSNNLSSRALIHLIDNYLKFNYN